MASETNPEDLSPGEKAAFDKLASHRSPPPSLEKKLINRLKTEGLLNSNTRFDSILMQFTFPRMAMAAVLIGFVWVTGFLIGQRAIEKEVASSPGPRFALLIHDDSKYAGDPREQAAAYANWMNGLQASGRFAAGQELQSGGQVLKLMEDQIEVTSFQERGAFGMIGGFFLIEAENESEAVQIASSCPHLQYDGTIEIRKIVER